MGNKNKSGRETRKPKLDKNKKPKGQTPAPGGAVAAITPPPRNDK